MSTISWSFVKVTDKKTKQCYLIHKYRESGNKKKYKCTKAARKKGDTMIFETENGEKLIITVTDKTDENWKISLAKSCGDKFKL